MRTTLRPRALAWGLLIGIGAGGCSGGSDVRGWLLAAVVDAARIAIESLAPRGPVLPPLRAVSST